MENISQLCDGSNEDGVLVGYEIGMFDRQNIRGCHASSLV
jgi:hypothetical protein